jgi:GTP-binding protein Era
VTSPEHRAGFAAIVGRPNVGKSTLLNALVGQKIAIVSSKPQTTRNRILAIRNLPEAQIVFLDTPGIHAARSLLNRRMVEVARQTLGETNAAILVLDASAGVTPADRELAESLAALKRPVIAVLNKLDRVRPPALLPAMEALGALLPGRDIIPASARDGANVPAVLSAVMAALPTGPPLYAADMTTTEPEHFLVQELVREQLFRSTEQEVPYGTAVTVEEMREEPERELLVIRATILVDRPSHKGIVIGAGGQQLREIGRRARQELEALFGVRVFLELFVRVEAGWAKNPRRLRELGL